MDVGSVGEWSDAATNLSNCCRARVTPFLQTFKLLQREAESRFMTLHPCRLCMFVCSGPDDGLDSNLAMYNCILKRYSSYRASFCCNGNLLLSPQIRSLCTIDCLTPFENVLRDSNHHSLDCSVGCSSRGPVNVPLRSDWKPAWSSQCLRQALQ